MEAIFKLFPSFELSQQQTTKQINFIVCDENTKVADSSQLF